jgi:hypothetical protein
MIDRRIINQLDSLVVTERIQAIKQLARLKNREALRHLAEVARTDRDPEVRELARKAGIYIKQNTPETPPARPDDQTTRSKSGVRASAVSVLPDEDEQADEPSPMLSEIPVTQADITRAQGYLDQAMGMSVRGNNERARELIQRALAANPRLMYDSYTMSLASNITGLPADEAIKRLAPSPDALRKKSTTRRTGRAAATPNTATQSAFALLTIAAAVVVLAGYLVFPWVDVWGYSDPTLGEMTVKDAARQGLSQAMNQQDVRQAAAELGITDPAAINRISSATTDYILNLNFSPSGLDTTNYATGFQNVFDVLGVFDGLEPLLREAVVAMGMSSAEAELITNQLDDVSGELNEAASDFGIPIKFSPDPLDYTYILIPVVALCGLALGLLSMMQASMPKWSIAFVLGLIGIIPLVYFYLSGFDHLVEGSVDLAVSMMVAGLGVADMSGVDISELADPQMLNALGVGSIGDLSALFSGSVNSAEIAAQVPKEDFIGLGYYVSAVGAVLLILLPLLAMLFLPEEQTA